MNIVIDVETTGDIPGTHEIIQIGAITFDNDLVPSERFMSYIRPLRPSLFTVEAFNVNGLSLDFLADKPVPAVVRTAFTCWLEDVANGEQLVPLGHNFDGFDNLFLKHFLSPEKHKKIFSYRSEDTCKILRYLKRRGSIKIESSSLDAGLKLFNIKRDKPHDAISDCLATLELYSKLVNLEGI